MCRPVQEPVPRMSAAQPARLVVVEHGVRHFYDQVSPDGSEHTVVVAQLAFESTEALTGRVRQAMIIIGRGGRRVGPAVMVLSPCPNEHANAARLFGTARRVTRRFSSRLTPSNDFYPC